MYRASKEPATCLRRDEDGALLLCGVFMCCVLASLIWYFVGIGDAILWRDRGQEVADSIALTSASCHARGMNMIALLNLIMMVVTMIFLIIKLADWVCMGLSLIALGIPFAEELSAPLWKAHDALAKADNAIQSKVIEPIFPWIGRVQIGVAVVAPYWGELSAWLVGTNYSDKDHGHRGFAASLSMAPLDWLTRLQKAGHYTGKPLDPIYPGTGGAHRAKNPVPRPKPFVPGPAGNTRQFIMPQDLFGREGLPVTADKYNSLCTGVINLLPDFMYTFTRQKFPGLKDILDSPGIKNVYSGYVKMSAYAMKEAGCPGPFWKSGQYTPPDTKDADDNSTKNTDPRCTPAEQKRRVAEIEAAGPQKPGPQPPDPGYEPLRDKDPVGWAAWNRRDLAYKDWLAKSDAYKAFDKQHQDRVDQIAKECAANGKQWTKDEVIAMQKKNRDLGPKFMVSYANNGNDWMQVWSFATGDPPEDSISRDTFKVIPKLFGRAAPEISKVDPASHWYYAQAEFYLDCHDRWFSVCNNFNLATFKVSWRARLRRVKHPDIISDLTTALVGSFFGSDWARDRFRQWFPDSNNMQKKLPNFLWNIGFALVKSNLLYETNLLAGHGDVYPEDLH